MARTILVVEDEYALAEALHDLLVDAGFAALTAHDGARALELLRAADPRPDLCLSDVMMPGLSGLELLRAIRNDPALAALPVVLMSAAPVADRATAEGATAFIGKPFDVDTLLRTLNATLVVGTP